MRNGFRFLIASLLMISVGCTDRGESDFIQYKMVNNSGHKITIYMEDFNKKFPAEVTLQNEEFYEWIGLGDEWFSSFNPFVTAGGEIRVEYDNNYLVTFILKGDNLRNPEYEQNYVKEKIGNHKYLYTYTFIEEDYENAVNQ